MAVGLAQLGHDTVMLGKVGDEAFGRLIVAALQRHGVDTAGVTRAAHEKTRLSVVSLAPDGERDFMFYRNPSADMLYTPADVDQHAVAIKAAKCFHYGSISLIGEPSRSAALRAIELASATGALISYDPNLRLPLWPSAEAARAGMLSAWHYAHVVKVSEEELEFLTGLSDIDAAVKKLWHANLRALFITRGKDGCYYYTSQFHGEVGGFSVTAVDTTGAGDGFVAGILKGLLEQPRGFDDETTLRKLCHYANAVGAITTTKRGAIPALPTDAEVRVMMSHGV